MKKRVLAITVILILCAYFAVSVSAIDTPWLPIEPDGADTETSSPTEEKADTTDVEEDSGHTTEALPSDTEDSIETDLRNSDTTEKELSKETGCGSTLWGYAVLAYCLTASVCVIKTRKENE